MLASIKRFFEERVVAETAEPAPETREHGLRLAAPPAGAGGSTVELTFALRGSLTPELDPSGRALRLKDGDGSTVLRYDQLAVYDAAGKTLSASRDGRPFNAVQALGELPIEHMDDCTTGYIEDCDFRPSRLRKSYAEHHPICNGIRYGRA